MSSSKGIAILTGANGAFGQHIAAGLVKAGFRTLCVVRDKVKGQALVDKLESQTGNQGLAKVAIVDCSSHASIKNFASTYAGDKIEILINNAVVTPTTRKESSDGIELQFATNVLGYHWFIKELDAKDLFIPNKAKIVNVASFYAEQPNLEDVEFKKRTYDPNSAYKSSKACNRMSAFMWGEKLQNKGITVTSCHPHVATSNCSLGLGFDLSRDEQDRIQGSVTPLFCALNEPSNLKNGGYYADSTLQKCEYCSKRGECEKLWDICEKY